MKRKKLYYIPGIISIIGLPVLLFFWGPPDPVYQKCIKLNIPSNAKDSPGIERFTKGVVYKAIKNKKIITIDLNDDAWDERSVYLANKKYGFVESEMERLQFTADTNSVLKIHFGVENTYSDFIWVLNRAIIYEFRRYALVDDDFYFLPSPHYVVSYEATALPVESYQVPERKEPTRWENFKLELKYEWRGIQRQFEYLFYQQQQNILLAGGLLLLVVLPCIIKIRKYFRSQNVYYSRT